MTDGQARFEELTKKLRERQHRMTPQRVALLRLLTSAEDHPSAHQLYERLREQFSTTSLATVYKTLSLLYDMGEVLELGFGNHEARFDANRPEEHPHLICLRCWKVIDGSSSLLPNHVQEVAKGSGFQVTGHRLDLYGFCPDCQASSEA